MAIGGKANERADEATSVQLVFEKVIKQQAEKQKKVAIPARSRGAKASA